MKHGTWGAYKEGCRCDECRTLMSDYQRNRRKNNPAARLKNLEYVNKRRLELSEYVKQLKDHPCTDCGVKYPYYVMHFDHLGVEPKVFTISNLPSKKSIDTEVKKCELVCANCHAERTQMRLGY